MNWEIKDLISLYAAIVSSGVLAWNVTSWKLNKGRIKLECREIINWDWEKENVGPKLLIEYRVMNTGEKPVTIVSIGSVVEISKQAKGTGKFLVQDLPYRLDGHSSFSHFRPAPDIFQTSGNINYIFVEDALGKVYKAKKKHVKRLTRKYQNKE